MVHLALLRASVGTAAMASNRQSVLTAAAYAGSFWLLGLTLKGMSLGVAYAIWAGAGTVLTVLVGMAVFKERPDFAAVLGISLIVVGVAVMYLFSKTVAH